MKDKNHFEGKTMHIDVSRRFFQRGDSAIAFKIIPTNEHKCIILSSKLKKDLKKGFDLEKNYSKLYAVCIYYLIKNNLGCFDNLVICNDENYRETKGYLDLFFKKNKNYRDKFITSISRLRKLTGDYNVRSYADNIANIYRKKGLRARSRRQRGIQLNLIEVNYRMIGEKWNVVK